MSNVIIVTNMGTLAEIVRKMTEAVIGAEVAVAIEAGAEVVIIGLGVTMIGHVITVVKKVTFPLIVQRVAVVVVEEEEATTGLEVIEMTEMIGKGMIEVEDMMTEKVMMTIDETLLNEIKLLKIL